MEKKPGGDAAGAAGRFRVVHTSGEKFVASEAEAKALMNRLPGARAYCATRMEPTLKH